MGATFFHNSDLATRPRVRACGRTETISRLVKHHNFKARNSNKNVNSESAGALFGPLRPTRESASGCWKASFWIWMQHLNAICAAYLNHTKTINKHENKKHQVFNYRNAAFYCWLLLHLGKPMRILWLELGEQSASRYEPADRAVSWSLNTWPAGHATMCLGSPPCIDPQGKTIICCGYINDAWDFKIGKLLCNTSIDGAMFAIVSTWRAMKCSPAGADPRMCRMHVQDNVEVISASQVQCALPYNMDITSKFCVVYIPWHHRARWFSCDAVRFQYAIVHHESVNARLARTTLEEKTYAVQCLLHNWCTCTEFTSSSNGVWHFQFDSLAFSIWSFPKIFTLIHPGTSNFRIFYSSEMFI